MERIDGQRKKFGNTKKFAVFMAVGAAGVLPLAAAVFADVGVMLLAVLNSLRMQAGADAFDGDKGKKEGSGRKAAPGNS